VGGALFHFPTGVSVDKNGFVFVADTYNNAVRWIFPSEYFRLYFRVVAMSVSSCVHANVKFI